MFDTNHIEPTCVLTEDEVLRNLLKALIIRGDIGDPKADLGDGETADAA